MTEREKAIRGLEVCARDQRSMHCENCPYRTDGASCINTLMHDALNLLKETKEMEDNKRELPFIYNVGDRLKYINGNGETITVTERRHEYNKETGTAKNIYFLTIEDYEGRGHKYLDWASESYMMTYMRRIYSPGKLFNPEGFEKRSNDALSCGYYKALEKENKMVNGENEALKRENEELREINEGLACSYENVKRENKTLKPENETQAMKDELKKMKDKLDLKEHEIDIWKKGWYDCLKSFGYYLNT